jgi:hypothetical protein
VTVDCGPMLRRERPSFMQGFLIKGIGRLHL